jgi:hypothetical protein
VLKLDHDRFLPHHLQFIIHGWSAIVFDMTLIYAALVLFLSLSRHAGIVLKLDHDRFLPDLFQFIIHCSSSFYTIWSDHLTASLNKPQINKFNNADCFCLRPREVLEHAKRGSCFHFLQMFYATASTIHHGDSVVCPWRRIPGLVTLTAAKWSLPFIMESVTVRAHALSRNSAVPLAPVATQFWLASRFWMDGS